METFSERLAALMAKKGINQKALSALIGVGRSYLAMVESGQKPFSEKLRRKVDTALSSSSISVIGNSGPVAVGSPGASLGGASPPGEGALSARVAALEARVAALERALVAALGKGRAD